jgi:DNA invertase Pin-like site-specific DNA recombinase
LAAAGPLVVAIYGRKSTEQVGVTDEQRSVTRQIEHARAYALAHGWVVSDKYIFVDDGISGAEFRKRPGLTRLLNTLRPSPPFQILLMSEESRLGREQIETAYVIKEILDAGVRLFYYLDDRERTLDSATEKVMLSLAGFASEMEREKAQQRTHDALSRLARGGYVTGGKVYGYDNVRTSTSGTDGGTHRPPARRVINPAQAAVVRRIFEWSAEGWGITRTAKQLNAEGISPPRGGEHGWAPSAVREMLYNELYRGRVLWNRTRKAHRRGTKTQEARAPEDRIEIELADCRIVSDDLWDAAHAALGRRSRVFVPQIRGSSEVEPIPQLTPPSQYLLSGLARCSSCGGPMIAMSRHHGRRRGYFYGCAHNWKRGPAICPNNLRLPQAYLDEAVLDAMVLALDAELVDAAVAQAFVQLTKTAVETPDRRQTLESQIAEVRRREQRLAEAISQGTPGDAAPEALLNVLRAEEARRKDLEQQLAVLPQATAMAPVDRDHVARELRTRADDMRGVLRRQGAQAREALRTLLLDRFDCTPVLVAGTRGYAFTGDGTFGGLLAASTWPTTFGGPNGIRTRVWSRLNCWMGAGYADAEQKHESPGSVYFPGLFAGCGGLQPPAGKQAIAVPVPGDDLNNSADGCAETTAGDGS